MDEEIGRRDFLRRSAMATAFAAVGSPVVQPSSLVSPSSDASPSAGVPDFPGTADASLSALRKFDSKDFCLSEYDAIVPAHGFSATNAEDAARWRTTARAKLVERLGGFPMKRSPLNAESLEVVDCGTYTREKIVFDTRSNLSAIGFLLVPKGVPRARPAVVCFSGHGRGVSDILGIPEDGKPRPERSSTYAREYGLQCVEHGYVTFAVEQLAFGARRDEAARAAGAGENSCRPAACAAVLFGQSMAGWRVWDAMRAIDYLGTRSEVDMNRIATLGASGGGTTSLLTAAVDERVRAAVVSAYFNTFRDSIVSISHCPDNYVAGLLNDMEMYDLAGLVAPRMLIVESGRDDRIFPIAGSQRAAARAREIFAASGAPGSFAYSIHDGGHDFSGVAAFDSLARSFA